MERFHIETLQEEEGEQREIEEDRDRRPAADRRRRQHQRRVVLRPLGHDSPHSLFLTFFLGSAPFSTRNGKTRVYCRHYRPLQNEDRSNEYSGRADVAAFVIACHAFTSFRFSGSSPSSTAAVSAAATPPRADDVR